MLNLLMSTDMRIRWLDHRIHTEWKWPLSGVHSTMRWYNQPSLERVGVHALPLYLLSRAKLLCSLQLRGQDILPHISPLLLYVLCGSDCHIALSASMPCQFAHLRWLSLPCVWLHLPFWCLSKLYSFSTCMTLLSMGRLLICMKRKHSKSNVLSTINPPAPRYRLACRKHRRGE